MENVAVGVDVGEEGSNCALLYADFFFLQVDPNQRNFNSLYIQFTNTEYGR